MRLSICLILLTKWVFISYGAMLPHQGRVLISGSPFEGTGLFRFALVDQSGAVVWNHEGTYGKPETDISIDVAKGFYQCRLGDTSIDGMAELPASIFVPDHPLKLRIWFNDGVNGLKRLGQDQNLMTAPYAMTSSRSESEKIAMRFADEIIRQAGTTNISVDELITRISSFAQQATQQGTITKEMLPADLFAEMNKTVLMFHDSQSMIADLNSSLNQALVAIGRPVTTEMLSEDIIKYLRPEIVSQTTLNSLGNVYQGKNISLSLNAEGKYLSYQWQKNGVNLEGEIANNLNLGSFTPLTQNGTYRAIVANDFGSVLTESVTLFRAVNPVDLNSTAPLTIRENLPAGTFVGQFTANDPDDGDLTYNLEGGESSDHGFFRLESNGSLYTNATFDFENNKSSYSLMVAVKDKDGGVAYDFFIVSVIDENEEQVATGPFVDENGSYVVSDLHAFMNQRNYLFENNSTLQESNYSGAWNNYDIYSDWNPRSSNDAFGEILKPITGWTNGGNTYSKLVKYEGRKSISIQGIDYWCDAFSFLTHQTFNLGPGQLGSYRKSIELLIHSNYGILGWSSEILRESGPASLSILKLKRFDQPTQSPTFSGPTDITLSNAAVEENKLAGALVGKFNADASSTDYLFGETLATGEIHSLFIKSDGSLWGMGNNSDSRLVFSSIGAREGTFNDYTIPVKVVDNNVASVSAGSGHSLFIKSDGSVWGMGGNSYRQLGIGPDIGDMYEPSLSPERIFSSRVAAASGGGGYSLFLMDDGSLWLSGLLIPGNQSWPKKPEKLVDANVTAMVAGYQHFLFLKSDGSLWGMGDNGSGQLGDGTNTDRTSPIRIVETGVTMVSAGRSHNLFLKSDGSVWGMGGNYYGQLGVGDNENKSSPVKLDIDGVVAVKAGGSHSCFLKSDGTLWTVGRNYSGQLGDGTTVDRNLPVQVATAVTDISSSCDNHHTLFRKTDGSLWAVGHNTNGQLGAGPLGNTVSIPREVTSGVANQGTTGTAFNETFFSLVDGNGSTHNHLFTIDTKGTLRTNAILDYEANPTRSIRVRVTDDQNGTFEKVFAISVTEEYEPSQPTQPPTHTVDLNSSVNLEMIWVEPGTFTMGSPVTDRARMENETEHNVTLTHGFYLGKYEVTQAQYEAVMAGNTDGLSATPSYRPNNPNRPVEQVSHHDIQSFLAHLNAQEANNLPAGWAYVLPTEAQWEYACRAGTNTIYSWGNYFNASVANYNQNRGETTNVGEFLPNPWGFYDMHGNVFEWTADWWGSYSYGSVIDPLGMASGSSRVNRGGAWSYYAYDLRSAARYHNTPSLRLNFIGFRVGFQKQ